MSFSARIVHTVGFEVFGILIFTPFAMFVLHESVFTIGVLAAVISLIAMVWNFIYNYMFDVVEQKFGGCRSKRKIITRIMHALLFEVGLLGVTIPMVAYWLNMSLLSAFLIDMGFVLFYLVYAFIYNYAFDKIYFEYYNKNH
jgi:uncharacterized membrane protein